MANQELVYPLPNRIIGTAKPAVLCPNGRASSLRGSALGSGFPKITRFNFI